MRGQLRNWDSKITFFAFADVITSVSGMLIFITLLLATDLDRPTETSGADADPQVSQKLQETFHRQAELDAKNQQAQELLALAETAPAAEQLQVDISRLRLQLDDERQKQAGLATQLAGRQDAIAARDQTLGLTGLKSKIERAGQEADSLASQESKVRREMASLEAQVSRVQSQLLKLRQFEGQIWLIPDRSSSTKEPILVTVTGSGISIDRLDRPDLRRQIGKGGADAGLKEYLRAAKPLDQYVVFELMPSGIELFQDLLKTAQDRNFDVGFDAMEEGKVIHLGARETPPADDQPVPPPSTEPASTNTSASTTADQFRPPTNSPLPSVGPAQPAKPELPTAPSVPVVPKTKSKWQRFLEWLHLA